MGKNSLTDKDVSVLYSELKGACLSIDKIEAFGFETRNVKKALDELLDDILRKLEFLPMDEDYPSQSRCMAILANGVWIPVNNFQENQYGGLSWSVNLGNQTDIGTSRFGHFADLDASGTPCMNINIEDLKANNF